MKKKTNTIIDMVDCNYTTLLFGFYLPWFVSLFCFVF